MQYLRHKILDQDFSGFSRLSSNSETQFFEKTGFLNENL